MKKTILMVGLIAISMNAQAASRSVQVSGESTNLAKCVSRAINNAIKDHLENGSAVGITTAAPLIESSTSDWLENWTNHDVDTTYSSRTPTFNELNYTLDQKALLKGAVSKDEYEDANGNTHLRTHTTLPLEFQLVSKFDGVTKYLAFARLASVDREYFNDGRVKRVSCTLKDVSIKSANTHALLLGSDL